MAELICEQCGEPTPRKRSAQRFCGRTCWHAWAKIHRDYSGANNPHWRGGKVELVCEECGESFALHPGVLKRQGEGRYCSRRCKDAAQTKRTGPDAFNWRGGKVGLTCIDCGRVREHDPCTVARFKQTTRCIDCDLLYRHSLGWNRGENNAHWKGGKAERVCQVCGKLFYVKQNVVRGGGGFFCSVGCRSIAWRGANNPAWRGGSVPYGPVWPDQRQRARNRDDYTCQRCGITEEELGCELSVHHIRRFGDSRDNSLENLISLCGNHNAEKSNSCHLHCEHHPEDCPVPRKHWLLTA